MHLRIFGDKFVSASVAALFLLIDSLNDLLHPLASKETAGVLNGSVESQPACTGGVLCQDDYVVEKLNHTIRRVCNDNYDLFRISYLSQLRHQFPCHYTVKTRIRLVQDEQCRV